MSDLTRREFVVKAAVAGATLQILPAMQSQASAAAPAATSGSPAPATGNAGGAGGGVALRWLDGRAPGATPGVTWGVPWPRGAVKPEQTFTLKAAKGDAIAMQTWPLAYWPDGSLKWTAHAAGPDVARAENLELAPGAAAAPAPKQPIKVTESPQGVDVDTGVIRCRVGRGANLIESIERDGRPIAAAAQLVALRQDQPAVPEEGGTLQRERFVSAIEKVTVEQPGPVRAVIRLDGKHAAAGGAGGAGDRKWLPFTVRLYFYAGSEAVRMMHSFVFDGDEKKDFIRGLGVRFAIPMRDQIHDRHIRFAGENGGLWAEGVRNLTGLRRDAGQPVITKQLAGEPTPPLSQFPANVRGRMELIPAYNDYTLVQPAANAFEIRKRTKSQDVCWITPDQGKRAPGLGYIGGITGGVAFGLRDFWQRHPTQLDVRGAATDKAEVTVWLWSPEAPAMDLRGYHDGMGMDTHAEELEGLEITYEDYEKGFDTAHGIARTSEITLWAFGATPPRQKFVELAQAVQAPALLVCDPKTYHAAGIFGAIWSLPNASAQAKPIEDELNFLLAHYQKEIDQRHWYGFWHYGDVMHSYDRDRHTWKYDVGGCAWDNSELSPDLWLWYSFLRTGRADVFRMAEAMTRHTGEVDVYHLGKFAMLGSRHNVLHWGCSAKQLRISTAVYRRFYYYLTADERVGDLMRELLDADKTFLTLDPIRKIRRGTYDPKPEALSVGLGTDWGSLAVAWLTEWERDPKTKYREKLLNGMKSIGAMKNGFFTQGATYNLATGAFSHDGGNEVGISHLSAVFGLVEICAELIQLNEVPEFERAWLQYCELYNAPAEERQKALGSAMRGNSLVNAHSRLTAYAAMKKKDKALAARAWREFHGGDGGRGGGRRGPRQAVRVEGPTVLNPVDEAPGVSTNDTSQWSLAAIQNLQLVGDALAGTNA